MAALAALCDAAVLPAQADEVSFVLAGDPAARLVWLRSFATRNDDWINDIVPLSGGRYLAVGFLNRDDDAAPAARDWRALAAVIRPDGSSASDRHYGGGGINAFWSAREGEAERLYLAGFTTVESAGGIDALAVATRPDGAVVAERRFGGPGYDRFTSLAPAPGGYVFLGHSQPAGDPRRRLFAVRTDGALAPLWERIIDGPESVGALYIEPAGDGGFIVSGAIGGETRDMFVLKLDADGRELWRRRIGTPEADDVNHGLALLPDGRIVVVGYSRSWGARDYDILAAMLSSDGELLRREMLGGAGDDRPILAKTDSEGRIVIVGWTHSAGAGGRDLLLARLDAEGRFEPGIMTFGSADDENGTAVRPLPDGSLLVAGYRAGATSRGQDAFVIRIAAPTWQQANAAFVRRTID